MGKDDKFYFDLLKKEVAATFSKNHSVFTAIKDWKGSEITLFQEDLFSKVKASVSEKWFYTYFKNDAEKLPRIDMLNLLCEYVGFESWNTFKGEYRNPTESNLGKKRIKYLVYGAVLIIGILWFSKTRRNEFKFCFVDELTDKNVVQVPLNIKVLNEKESSISLKTDSLGCFSYKTKDKFIRFVVKSPYHKTDTIIRYIETSSNESVRIASDDYALMLGYYVSGNIRDWKEHKKKLGALISDDAIIYQMYTHSIGVEIHSKDDFIRMLTIPTSSLKGMKILEKHMENGKITKLKFTLL